MIIEIPPYFQRVGVRSPKDQSPAGRSRASLIQGGSEDRRVLLRGGMVEALPEKAISFLGSLL